MEKLKLEIFIVFLTKIHRFDPFARELAEFDDSRCVNSDFVEKEEREREREERRGRGESRFLWKWNWRGNWGRMGIEMK